MSYRNLSVSLVLMALVGCGSTEDSTPVATDSGSDTGTAVDTGRADTGTATETGGVSCESPLPSGFACAEPLKGTPGTACSEAALADFVNKCLNAEGTVPTECAAWKTANAACATCVASWSWADMPGQVYPDDYKCYWQVMDPTCAKASNCSYDCQAETCGDCDSSEAADCADSVTSAGGKCYDVAAKKAEECFTTYDTALGKCNVDEIYAATPDMPTMRAQVLRYYRGACRDNGVWTNSESAGDGGVSETGSETGTDAATDAATDSATDASSAG